METDQVKQNGKKFQEYPTTTNSKYREVLNIIIQNPPQKIRIGNWDELGLLSFTIDMTDVGLTYKDYYAYEDEFFSYFIVDFLGELIIRENIQLFVDKLQECDINNYMVALSEYGTHRTFGCKTHRGKLTFEFHISLLKDILTADLRDKLGDYK